MIRGSALLALMLPLAACAPQAGQLASPRAPSDLETQQSFAAPIAAWPDVRWWSSYGDPQLNALMAEAAAGSPDLATAAARVRQANALLIERRAPLLPSVTLDGQATYEKQSYNNGIPPEFVPHGWNDAGRVTLGGSFDLDLWGRNRAALVAATSQAQAAQVDAAQAALLLTTNVAAAYADLAQAFADRDIAARAVELRGSTLQLNRDRVANGLANQGEAQLADSRAAVARADLAAADETIALQRNRLAALLGAGPDRGLAIDRPKIAALHPFGLPGQLALDLVGRRPDIVSARLQAEAARSSIRSARAAFYPNIDLTGLIGVQSLGLSNLTDSGSTIGSVGPALSLPLFNRGQLTGELRGAEARYDLAVASYDTALVTALREVADAAASIRALDTRRRETAAALKSAEDAYSIAQQRYRGGLSTYLDVLTAEDSVLDRRRAAAAIETRGFALDVALVRALGGGFTDPTTPARSARATEDKTNG